MTAEMPVRLGLGGTRSVASKSLHFAICDPNSEIYFSTVTFVVTELAIKQLSWVAWCILLSYSLLGLLSPDHLIHSHSSTHVIPSLHSGFFSILPTASSVY